MKLLYVLVMLLGLGLVAPVSAQQTAPSLTKCAVQDWMTTLYYRAQAITPANGPPSVVAVVALREHRFAKDEVNLRVALRQAGLGHLEPATRQFLLVLDRILATPDLLRSEPGRDRGWRAALARFNQTIALLDCSAAVTKRQIGPLHSDVPGAMPLDRFAVVVLALSVSAMCFGYLASKYLLHLGKIMKRYMIRLPCTLQFATTAIPAELVDISRSGAKVQIQSPLADPGKMTVLLPGLQVPGYVAWHNTNFAGVRFQRKLTRAEIQLLRDNPLAQAPDPPAPATKGFA